ncbi:hypothetical protein A9C19_19995 [Bacillus weihaiensis]|uniref:Group-specific protein n=1 Tax=Bacillus weihaiensis TaxID=1547283 RepID=A0A1L3MWR8_9BACI|nr:hypothetical protein A9C19_19995 [Bacillus weihaiensis]
MSVDSVKHEIFTVMSLDKLSEYERVRKLDKLLNRKKHFHCPNTHKCLQEIKVELKSYIHNDEYEFGELQEKIGQILI